MAYIKNQADVKEFKKHLERTISRGPDATKILEFEHAILGFQRLSIMGLNEAGMQPFTLHGRYVICNGELYGFRKVKDELIQKGYNFQSESDCEIILPLYEQYGTDMFQTLDAEFACVIYDTNTNDVIAARDPIGIRPLFYGYDANGNIAFASEAKNLVGMVEKIIPFPCGYYYKNGEFVCYRDITQTTTKHTDPIKISQQIHDLLIKGIKKRLDSDAKVGFLLSGGLDSSLVCAISAKLLNKPIETFSIGMESDAIDLKYAKQVANYIGSNHHEIIITKEDVLNSLNEVIYTLATFDITTIRASVGMYLICKKIHEISDVKVLLTGEISDELFGYKYTDFAPDAKAFQEESVKRIKELYMYDVLRADRCISTHSLEARVPFGDLDFVEYVMNIDPELKLNTYNKGKYLLRHAFEEDQILPYDILMREKAAFSDAVGHSLVDDIKEYAQTKYSEEEYNRKIKKYDYIPPFTKEALLYREIFESFYPNQAEMIKDYWMPNPTWPGCQVNDPSARVLSNYGDSGK